MKTVNTEFGTLNICVEDFEKFEGFTLKKGFVVLDKETAAEQLDMETLSIAVISIINIDRDYCWCRAFVETEGGWEMDYPELYRDFAELLHDLKETLFTYKAKPEGELYEGGSFIVTDVIPGEKCNNGGEYGFYTEYILTDIPGLYAMKTSCTCDFDRCGTGFEGLRWLTLEDYDRIVEKSLEPVTETAKDYSSPTLQLFK